ncbi:MAG: tRNA (guanosine(37)-N1)-methyltransferase TrmD [Calditrichae bacterium]|nr:tRNA (guanosine(37)-N1)-methyltransferase TrmD [Calditrichia bacterium]
MQIDVITAFPNILQAPLNESILKQAKKRIQLTINVHDLRQFATDKHRVLDDTPYGGGPGMVLKPEPLFRALEYVISTAEDRKKTRIIFPTPQGKLFSQDSAEELSEWEHLVFICGHYKGVDQRVIDTWVTDEISIGDYILSGGEIPTLLIIDGIIRLVPGAIHDIGSAKTDSFQNSLLDCPYYTRPEVFRGMKVPEVLISGNHARIDEWRKSQRIDRTKQRRPDLFQKFLKEHKNSEN